MEFLIENGVLVKYNGDATNVLVPEEVTVIGDGAFEDRYHIQTVILPKHLKRIGNWAFSRLMNLSSIEIPEEVECIGLSAFRSCISLNKISIPDSIRQISGKAFEFCKSLTAVTLPDKIQVLAEKTFSNCMNLREISLPEGLKEIGSWAFEGCVNLTDIKIPDSTEIIEESAFLECTSLARIKFGKSIRKIKYNAFSETAWINEQDGDYVKIGHILIQYNGKAKAVVIPQDVTEINHGCFEYCKGIESVVIHEKVYSIEEKAFYGCSRLRFLTLPASLNFIHYDAFHSCPDLKIVVITGCNELDNGSEFWDLYQLIYPKKKADLKLYLPGEKDKLRFHDFIRSKGFGIEINFQVYDDKFQQINELREKAVMAVLRLLYPVSLKKENYNLYFWFLKSHIQEILEFFIKSEYLLFLRIVTELSLIPPENVEVFIQMAAGTKNVEITSYLLSYKNEVIGYTEKEYAL